MQHVIKRDGLLAKVRSNGAYFAERLRAVVDHHPCVGDVRGRGLFMGVELVEDKASKRPFHPSLKLHAKVKAEAMSRGLMLYPMGGAIDGANGDHVLLAPPFIASRAELDTIVERFASAIDAAAMAMKRAA